MHRAMTSSFPMMVSDGERCATSATAVAAPMRWRSLTPRRDSCGSRCTRARHRAMPSRKWRSRNPSSRPRPMRSSKRSRALRAAVSSRAAFPASSRTGPSWASTGVPTAVSCPRTARLKWRAAVFSIEPYIVESSKVTTWADVAPTQALAAGYLPLPQVVWQQPGVAPAVFGVRVRNAGKLGLVAGCERSSPRCSTDLVTARARGATIPGQSTGAVSERRGRRQQNPRHRLGWHGVDRQRNPQGVSVAIARSDRNGYLRRGARSPMGGGRAPGPAASDVHDPSGYASAALGYDV